MNLRTKIISATSVIVVILGLLTVVAINTVVRRTLSNELTANGLSLVQVSGEAIANALLDGDLLVVQETLDNLKAARTDIVYAYAYGPTDRDVIHTFSNGFPVDLLKVNMVPSEQLSRTQRLITEIGPVQDIGWRPLDGLNAELHVGLSESAIQATLQNATWVIALITIAGMLTGVIASIAFGRFVTRPLGRLTIGVERFGKGNYDETIPEGGRDEIGDLSRAFNQMASDLRASIRRLQNSEANYRTLINAASQVGEGIALIRDEQPGDGTFLFVNEEFSNLTGYSREQLLGLNAAEVIHPQSLDDVYKAWQLIHSEQDNTLRHEMTLFTREGRKVFVETGGTLIQYQGHRALAWFMRDITERKMREIEIQRRNRELAALNAVAAYMSGPGDIDKMLQNTLEQAIAALELPAGWVFILGKGDKSPRLVALCGLQDSQDKVTFEFPRCDCGSVLQTGKPIVVKSNQFCVLWGKQTSTGKSISCHGSVPIIANRQVIGVLSAASTSSQCFDEDNFRLLVTIGRQMGIALENAWLWTELQEKEQMRVELYAKAIQAQEDERRRIARELHDETGQSLNALIFGLTTAEVSLTTDPEQAATLIGRLKSAAGDTVRELQSVIYDLRPSLLDDLGLIPALRWFAESRLEPKGIQVKWEIQGSEQRLTLENETALFRIAQEALTNISKYAQATEVDINLNFMRDRVILEIQDDGKGFDAESMLAYRTEDGRGLGLLGMRERTELLGGYFSATSIPGRGTTIHAELPVILFDQTGV